jgi:hypothetical protein
LRSENLGDFLKYGFFVDDEVVELGGRVDDKDSATHLKTIVELTTPIIGSSIVAFYDRRLSLNCCRPEHDSLLKAVCGFRARHGGGRPEDSLVYWYWRLYYRQKPLEIRRTIFSLTESITSADVSEDVVMGG